MWISSGRWRWCDGEIRRKKKRREKREREKEKREDKRPFWDRMDVPKERHIFSPHTHHTHTDKEVLHVLSFTFTFTHSLTQSSSSLSLKGVLVARARSSFSYCCINFASTGISGGVMAISSTNRRLGSLQSFRANQRNGFSKL